MQIPRKTRTRAPNWQHKLATISPPARHTCSQEAQHPPPSTARNHDCEARFFNISGSCFGHLIFGICHGDARRRCSRRPKKTNLTEIFFFPNFFQQFAPPSPKVCKFLKFLKSVCRARRRGFLLEDQAMLRRCAARAARAARAGRAARARKFAFQSLFSNLRVRPRRFVYKFLSIAVFLF